MIDTNLLSNLIYDDLRKLLKTDLFGIIIVNGYLLVYYIDIDEELLEKYICEKYNLQPFYTSTINIKQEPVFRVYDIEFKKRFAFKINNLEELFILAKIYL